MQSSEIRGHPYLVPPYPTQLSMLLDNSTTFQRNLLSNNSLYNFQTRHQVFQEVNQNSYGLSCNSTSDEADEQHQSLMVNERKQKRMISNRESARRSRMRKQRHLDELWSQVVWLRNENHQLMDKLNNASQDHDKFVQENAKLKEEATELRQMINDMQLLSPNYQPNLNSWDFLH